MWLYLQYTGYLIQHLEVQRNYSTKFKWLMTDFLISQTILLFLWLYQSYTHSCSHIIMQSSCKVLKLQTSNTIFFQVKAITAYASKSQLCSEHSWRKHSRPLYFSVMWFYMQIASGRMRLGQGTPMVKLVTWQAH